MIAKLQTIMHQLLQGDSHKIPEADEKKLALYGILYEAARSDHHVAPEEELKIREIMERYFSIGHEEFQRIKDEAEAIHLDSSGMFQITRDVRKHLSRDERLTLLDELWEIAHADGIIDAHENSILSRLSDLLGLEHSEFIDSKLRVAKKLNNKG